MAKGLGKYGVEKKLKPNLKPITYNLKPTTYNILPTTPNSQPAYPFSLSISLNGIFRSRALMALAMRFDLVGAVLALSIHWLK
jgi:hypothetical protein